MTSHYDLDPFIEGENLRGKQSHSRTPPLTGKQRKGDKGRPVPPQRTVTATHRSDSFSGEPVLESMGADQPYPLHRIAQWLNAWLKTERVTVLVIVMPSSEIEFLT